MIGTGAPGNVEALASSKPMRSFLLALIVALASPTLAQTLTIHCGTLLDPARSMVPMVEMSVVVTDGLIQEVVEGFTDQADAIDLTAATCMPGLIDSHTHLTGESRKDGYIDAFRFSPAERALRAAPFARSTLMAGFTTVRDVGGNEGVDLELRDAIARGDIAGPRMYVASKSLSITGGHADPTNSYREDIVGVPDKTLGIVNGVDSAVEAVRIAIKRGADLIKFTATGGVLSLQGDGTGAHFSMEEMQAIVETANNRGLTVAAHAHGDEGMAMAVRAGVSSIEHGTYMSDATMALMRERGTYLVPTITAGKSVADSARIQGYYTPVVTQKSLEVGPRIQGTFERAWRAGVPIAFGTDAGVFRHGRNANEFIYMTEVGMPFMEALKTATVNAADLLNQSDRLGALQPGYAANLVAVAGDPLTDARAMLDVSFVMVNGRVAKQGGQFVPLPPRSR
ncbi:MAG: amidohydrolase family protein [Bacteroidota bacterium]